MRSSIVTAGRSCLPACVRSSQLGRVIHMVGHVGWRSALNSTTPLQIPQRLSDRPHPLDELLAGAAYQ